MLEINTDVDNEVHLAGDLLWELYQKYHKLRSKKHFYKNLKELTTIESNTIWVIGYDGMRSMSQIANSLGVSFGTPTVTIDRLIRKGYVERIRDEEDRRQVFVRLSEKGKEIFNTIAEVKNEFAEGLISILTPEERKVFISMLSKLNNRFDEVF